MKTQRPRRITNKVLHPVTANTAPTPVKQPTTQATLSSSANQPVNAGGDSLELEKAAYTVALDAYKQGGAKKAIAPMKNFIKNNPNSVYISNAYFWLAEFNLAVEPTNYAEAKKNYSIVVDQYPESTRAPRALYQLYSIAKDVDRNSSLATQLKTKLTQKYPKSEEAGFVKK